jgi:hypothetical protein
MEFLLCLLLHKNIRKELISYKIAMIQAAKIGALQNGAIPKSLRLHYAGTPPH